jgi:excisionase family DNA binding protein
MRSTSTRSQPPNSARRQARGSNTSTLRKRPARPDQVIPHQSQAGLRGRTSAGSFEESLLAAYDLLAEAEARNAHVRRLLQQLLVETQSMPRAQAPTDVEPLISLVEVATRVGLVLPSGRPANSLYRAIERGELAAYRVSGRWRVRPSDFEAWIAGHRHTPEAA